MSDLSQKSFQTRAVHAGERVPPADYRPVSTPIWPTVGYLYENMDDLDAVFAGTKHGQIYLSYSNPTVEAFETAVADLEMAVAAQAYGSGMAASCLAAAACRRPTGPRSSPHWMSMAQPFPFYVPYSKAWV
jgi:O-acetylhomoserine/O-acetylserine sulfhydrylase-like pyridoxal-dependent enzyme